MKIIIWTLSLYTVLASCEIKGQIPFVCKGDFYLSQSMGITVGRSNLFTVNVDSITQEIIFNALPSTNEHSINAIGYRVTDNFVYGLDPTTKKFYKIDATGKSFFLRTLDELDPDDEYFGADIFPSGSFMVMIGGETFDKNLVIINLDNPDYPTEVIPLKVASTGGNPNTRIVDIAFDPLTKDLYGMDIVNHRIVKILIGSGTINDDIFPLSSVDANIAAMFFDAFGNLYGYGSAGGVDNYGMYRINKVSGQLTFATLGPSTGGVDGCSCPFNISMEKAVYPDTAFVCSDILYVFKIANGSLAVQSDITLEDILPPTFKIMGIDYNPYQINAIEGIGTNSLVIEGITIPPGLDSIVLRVNVGNSIPGTYGNLAILKNLPEVLGSTRFSENPISLRIGNKDSTYITLVSPITSFEAVDGICAGDSAVLFLNVPGAEYLWQDGSTDSFYVVTQPGTYAVTATNGCDTYMESVVVEEESISLSFVPSTLTVVLGDGLELVPTINNTGTQTFFTWTDDPLLNSLNCIDCPNPIATPISDQEYNLNVENEYGCSASASVFINVEINRNLYIPNIFSPNNDNLNDRFFIQGAGGFEINFFHIYDRWGNLVYDGNGTIVNDPTAGWDGLFNGKPLDTGVYTWQIVIRYLDEVESKVTGSITLIR